MKRSAKSDTARSGVGAWCQAQEIPLTACSEGKQFEALASTTRNSPVVALQWIAEQLVQRVEEPVVESFLDSCRVWTLNIDCCTCMFLIVVNKESN
ncbi:hypothetical protein EMCRGX_G008109 [Ephydatia muelleri]